jgi:diketogulonate reductase-like aldo/keto reductase
MGKTLATEGFVFFFHVYHYERCASICNLMRARIIGEQESTMKVLDEKWKLNDGNEIPALGLGFWQVKKEDASRVVKEGFEVGYTHFDTAIAYDNEAEMAPALSKLPRESYYLTSKVPAQIKNAAEAKKAIEESLSRLGVDYLDLMLIHAPKPWSEMRDPDKPYRYEKENAEVFEVMKEAQKAGKIKSIGVSNFNVEDLKSIIEKTGVVPAVNQIPCYIGHIEEDVIAFCKEKGILVEGYSPLATGQLVNLEAMKELAEKKGVSIPQLCIRFVYQLGVLPLPKTTHKEFMEANKEIDFELSEEEMSFLKSISFTRRRLG